MKSIFISFVIAVTVCTGCKTTKRPDSVSKADSINASKSKKIPLNTEVADFLVKIADARMMDIKEGKDAMEKATTAELKIYGSLMVQDHTMLLTKIRELAAARSMTLPLQISQDKKEGLEEQVAKTGKEFDENFVKMMIIDHKRDISDFKKAEKLEDDGVHQFVVTYLPLIQSHLDKLEAIKKEKD
jgi:putative membrane protein